MKLSLTQKRHQFRGYEALFFFSMTLLHSIISIIPSLVTKGSNIQKVSYGQSNFFSFFLFTMTLTLKKLNTAIQFFHKTFWFTMIYYQAEFGCIRISSAFTLSNTLAPTSGTISPKTSGTLLLSLPSKVNSFLFSEYLS